MLLFSFLPRIPPVPNFAKIRTRVGRGRLEVGCRDLIPPWGYTGCAGVACRGFGAVPGRRPARGWGGCAGRGRDSGPGAVPGQACRGWQRCARAASLPGRGQAAVCPGKRGGRGAGAVPGRFGGGFFPGAAQKLFFKRPFAHVLGSARGWFRKIGG